MTTQTCPHCRGQAETVNMIDELAGRMVMRHWVECTQCRMTGPTVDTEQDAVVVWNALPRRAAALDHNPSARAPGGGDRAIQTPRRKASTRRGKSK